MRSLFLAVLLIACSRDPAAPSGAVTATSTPTTTTTPIPTTTPTSTTTPTTTPTTTTTPTSTSSRCGRLPGEPIERVKSPWDDYERDCSARATTWANVPHADRACRVDADCVAIAGSCFSEALNQSASRRKEYERFPCTNPAAGACLNPALDARCIEGCCAARPHGMRP